MLALLDVLKPVVDQASAHVPAMRNWLERRAAYLQATGQWDKSLAVRRDLAERYPHDCNIQAQYARSLSDDRDYEAAYAWIAKVVVPAAEWLPNEEESLRNVTTDLMRRQGRYAELADYLAAWMKANPDSQSPYQQYFRGDPVLRPAGRGRQTGRPLAGRGQSPEKLAPDAAARLRAAVTYALGQGTNYNRDRVDPKWFKPLADAVLFFAAHDKDMDVAQQIMGHYHFTPSDECRRVRKEAAKILRGMFAMNVSPVGGSDPPSRISNYINWISANDPAVEPELWKQIAAGLRASDGRRARLGQEEPDRRHPRRRPLRPHRPEGVSGVPPRQLEKGPQEYRAGFAGQLFNALLAQPWSAEYENEAFGLLEQLSNAEEPDQRLRGPNRRALPPDRPHGPGPLPGPQGHDRAPGEAHPHRTGGQARREPQGGPRGLRQPAPRGRPEASAAASRWMTIERVYLDVLLGRNLSRRKGSAGRCSAGRNPWGTLRFARQPTQWRHWRKCSVAGAW